MNKILLITFLLLKMLGAEAQPKTLRFSLDENGKVIELLPDYILTQVIDAREDTSLIGKIKHYGDNDLTTINFSKPFTEEFKNATSNSFDADAKKQLIIKVNDASLNVENNLQHFFISLTFIEKVNDVFTELFTATETDLRAFERLHRKFSLQQSFTSVIGSCFISFKERKQANKLVFNNLNIDSLYKRKIINATHPDKLNKGIFTTFYDFRDNTPDIDVNIKPKYWLHGKSNNMISAKLNKKNAGIWGFSDGVHTYINGYDTIFQQLHLKDNKLLFYDYPIIDQTPGYDAMMPVFYQAGIIGGIIGAIVVTTLDENKKKKHNKRSNDELLSMKGNYLLDTKTQTISKTNEKIEVSKKEPVIYLLNQNVTNPISIIFTINESEKAVLGKSESALCRTTENATLNVCVQTDENDKQCKQIVCNAEKPLVLTAKTHKGKIDKLEVVINKIDVKDYINEVGYKYKLVKIFRK